MKEFKMSETAVQEVEKLLNQGGQTYEELFELVSEAGLELAECLEHRNDELFIISFENAIVAIRNYKDLLQACFSK